MKYASTVENGPFKDGYNFEYEFQKLQQFVEQADKIRVWSSHLDCNDYCLLLFICNNFSDKNISAFFSEEFNWCATTCTKLNENEINELLNKEHIFKKDEIKQYKEEWGQVVIKNTELRFMINGSVKSVDINYFDNKILNRLSELGKVSTFTLIANLMTSPIIPFVYYPDYIYLYLINRLIDNKLIKVKKNKEDKFEILSVVVKS